MLIIEGPDLVGKTTLAKRIAAMPQMQGEGMTYRHLSRLPEGFEFPWQYLTLASSRTIYDRFHMSEPVYATARGDQTDLCPEAYRIVDGHLAMLGAYTVVITAHSSLIKERFAGRAESEMYNLDIVLKANQLFSELVTRDASSELVAYEPRFDAWFQCNGVTPFVDDEMVEHIVTSYLTRRARLRQMLESREVWD